MFSTKEILLTDPTTSTEGAGVERQTMNVDVVCVGFGPAMGGFLTTLSRALSDPAAASAFQSAAMPGMPPQVLCYERAEDLGFGVSGVVTRARGIRQTFPDLDPSQIPMATPVGDEKVLYLFDPVGASRRSAGLKVADRLAKTFKFLLKYDLDAIEIPFTPEFLHKKGGLVLSIGQFNQWVGAQVMGSGAVQVWPGTPVSKALVEGKQVVGVRLLDQGTDKQGRPEAGFMPGMDVRAPLTVVGDGPVGPVGRQLDEELGMPDGHHRRDWAVGCKMVVSLRDDVDLKPGTVLHTFGYPEPEIFGFMYVHPDRMASVGIFVPSWMDSPVRTSYRYLQHYMMHPYLWRYLKGGTLRSWGAKTLLESGMRGEPQLAGDGWARIGEGSGSTNVLTGSGVDEAWSTGVQLAEGVLQLWKEGKPFTRENLDATYVARRRASWVEAEGKVAEKSRDGFQRGMVTGLLGMAIAGVTGGKINLGPEPVAPHERIPSLADYYAGRIAPEELERIQKESAARGVPLHEALMDRAGWPAIPYDGQLLVSHQDALLMGGKVQAPGGFADHVVFTRPELCKDCGEKICISVCSGQAITLGEGSVPAFDREKCVHCGACLWNCSQPLEKGSERTNVEFRAGAGGLHSAQN
jgi:electron-transferring-flavoprotein dehydrogenase